MRRPFLAAALLVALALAGCGGGAEEPGSRPASVGTAPSSQSSTAGATATATVPNTTTSAAASTSGQAASGATAKAPSGAAAEAEAICARRNRELHGTPIGSGMSATASAASRQAAIEQRALTELGKLTPPAQVAQDWGKLLTQTKISLEDVLKLSKAAEANDSEGVTRQLAALNDPNLRLLVAGAHTGLRKCAVIG